MQSHETKITLTHLNIRQSIAILLAKLIVTDIIFSFLIIGFYFVLVHSEKVLVNSSQNTLLFLVVFGWTGLFKIGLSIFIILEWLNEYYEITSEAVYHKRGIIHNKTEKYDLGKVRAISIEDSFLGQLCNFATVTLYDVRLNKYLDMYLIHNPKRYVKILRTLKPNLELKTDRIRMPFKQAEEDFDELKD